MSGTGLHVDATIANGDLSVSAVFDVAPRRVLLLTGSTDAATAVVRAIAGRLPVTAGTIEVDGAVVSRPGRTVSRELRRVGAVFDGYRLSSKLTVRDHVATVFRRRGVPLVAARDAAQPWLERFELDHLANLRPADLEPVQRMRLALARALAADPAVLVLDDPLGPLAESARPAARAALRSLLRDFGRPVVLASADAEDRAALAADTLVLRG